MSDEGLHRRSAGEIKAELEAARDSAPFLVFRDALGHQELVGLPQDGGPLLIGRDGTCDVVLDWDGQASRVHAELVRTGGAWTISDDGLSRNGTFVNDKRLHGRCRLEDGDRIRIGETGIVFRSPVPGEAAMTMAAPDTSADEVRITDAQRRVLVALCRPFAARGAFVTPPSNQEIASELFLSVDAVKTHIRTLFGKLAIEDLQQNQKRIRLVEVAMRRGLVSPTELEG